jgi:hypothetical protein
MTEANVMPKTALTYEVEVTEEGRVELQGPFSPGERIIIFVVKAFNAPFEDDLIQAAQSSLDFWDNPFDDEDWNNA